METKFELVDESKIMSDLKEAYNKVYETTKTCRNLGLKFEKLKEETDIKILDATAQGKIIGRNEQERKACAFKMFSGEMKFLDTKLSLFKQAQIDLELARIHLEYVRDLLRILELTKEN